MWVNLTRKRPGLLSVVPSGTEETRCSLKSICLCDFTTNHRIKKTSNPFLNSWYSWFLLLVAAEGRAKPLR
jgi:hypothetical protein